VDHDSLHSMETISRVDLPEFAKECVRPCLDVNTSPVFSSTFRDLPSRPTSFIVEPWTITAIWSSEWVCSVRPFTGFVGEFA